MAISFYSLFGYETEYKFRAGPARAAWLTLSSSPQSKDNYDTSYHNNRIELIEVPSYMLRNDYRAPDLLISRPDILGYNHIAIDVTHQIHWPSKEKNASSSSSITTSIDAPQVASTVPSSSLLTTYIQQLNDTSIQRFNKTLRMALFPPQQQMIGPHIYEIAFVYDADGSLIELLYCTPHKLQQNISSGWEPWDSTTFL
jgi:hypothetical protein